MARQPGAGNKHAFLIMAHKDDGTFRTLLTLLDDPRNDIFVHMDSKNVGWDPGMLSCVKRAGCFAVSRMNVTWGGYSQVACEIGLLSAAVEHGRYAYYHLLSGQDLPIKSQDEIHAFFDACGGKEFVRFENHGRDYSRRLGGCIVWNAFGKSKTQYGLRRVNAIVSRTVQIVRRPAKGLEVMKGDNWFSITDRLARHIVANKETIRSIFWDSMCGDELFLQTFAWASRDQFDFYRMPGEPNADGIMRMIDWGDGESPRVFDIGDLERIKASEMMFARKFDGDVDAEIIRAVAGLANGDGDFDRG